jgi:hypothetical protein
MTCPPPDLPAPPLARSDLWRVVALVAVAVAVHGWVMSRTAVTARDSVGFARYAFALKDPKRAADINPAAVNGETPSWQAVLRAEPHPPGYPQAVLATATVVQVAHPTAPETERMLFAAQLASSIAGVLVVVPVFALGRMLFGASAGFWAALLLQLLPVFATDTSDGLSDGPFLLCVTSALAIAVWATDRPKAGRWFLVCGAVAGVAYLIRPEGVLVPLAVGGGLLLRAVKRPRCWGQPMAVVTVAVGFLLVGGPYMAVIGGFTNKPSLLKNSPNAEPAAAVGGGLFAESIPKGAVGWDRLGCTALAVGKEFMKAGHYGVAAFAVIGLVCVGGRVVREPRFWPPVLYAGGQVAAVFVLGWKQSYVSERHLLPVMAVGVVFAAGGLPVWQRWWAVRAAGVPGVGRLFAWTGWPAFTCLILAVAGAWQLLGTRLHDNRAGHRQAGAKLKHAIDAIPPDERGGVVVMDHYQWCQFFSERAVYAIPPDPPPAAQRVVFVVVEMTPAGEVEKPDFDSTRHVQAVDYFNTYRGTPHLEVIHHWPDKLELTDPHAPPPGARMVLAKITLPK